MKDIFIFAKHKTIWIDLLSEVRWQLYAQTSIIICIFWKLVLERYIFQLNVTF